MFTEMIINKVMGHRSNCNIVGSFHKKRQFLALQKPKIYHQMNDTKILDKPLKQFVMQILAESHSLLEFQFFSIDCHIFKRNRNDFKIV